MSWKSYRLFTLFTVIMAVLSIPATARASDQDPQEGIDYFIVGGPNKGSTYYRLRDGANVYSPKLFEKLGTDMESFREDNRSITIPLCRTAKGGYWSPNESKHESDAAWQSCSADRRYLYVLPGTRFEISGQKMLSFDKRLALSAKMLRCRQKADCINEQLTEMGIAPKYGASAPAAPDPDAVTCAKTDLACLTAAAKAAGLKDPPPTPPIATPPVPVPQELTFGQRHGVSFAHGFGFLALLLLLVALYFRATRQFAVDKAVKDTSKSYEAKLATSESDYQALQQEKDRTIGLTEDFLKTAVAEATTLWNFVTGKFALDLGVRLEPDTVAVGRNSVAIEKVSKALEVSLIARSTSLVSALGHLGVNQQILTGKSFAELVTAIGARAKDVKSEVSELASQNQKLKEAVKAKEDEHAKAFATAEEDHRVALDQVKAEHAAELDRLREFIPIKQDAEQLKLAYQSYAAVKRGLDAKLAEQKRVRDAQDSFPEDEFKQLGVRISDDQADSEQRRRFSLLANARQARQSYLTSLETDVSDLKRELQEAMNSYQSCLNRMEMHLAVPLSEATVHALADETLIASEAKLAEAIALQAVVLQREAEVVELHQILKEAEKKLIEGERALEARLPEEIQAATTVLQARVNDLEDELRAEKEVTSVSLRAPALPSDLGNGNGNGHGKPNGQEREHAPRTRTMPFSPNGAEVSPFDLLMPHLQQFCRDASAVRPRLELEHVPTILHFLGSKFELGRTVFQRVSELAKNGDPETRTVLDASNPDLQRLADAPVAGLLELSRIFPFLMGEKGPLLNGSNGRSSSVPSSM